MRQLKVLGICIVALLTVGGMSASVASATHLFLKTKNGGVAPAGTPTRFVFVGAPESPPAFEFCEAIFATGTLTVNGAPKDKSTDTEIFEGSHCSEQGGQNANWFLGTAAIELTNKGKFTIKAQVKFERVGPCVYEIKKIKGAFTIGGEVQGKINGVIGKRNPKLSNIMCSKTQKFLFEWYLYNNGNNQEIVESELRP
jgi:hypothetical protein